MQYFINICIFSPKKCGLFLFKNVPSFLNICFVFQKLISAVHCLVIQRSKPLCQILYFYCWWDCPDRILWWTGCIYASLWKYPSRIKCNLTYERRRWSQKIVPNKCYCLQEDLLQKWIVAKITFAKIDSCKDYISKNAVLHFYRLQKYLMRIYNCKKCQLLKYICQNAFNKRPSAKVTVADNTTLFYSLD